MKLMTFVQTKLFDYDTTLGVAYEVDVYSKKELSEIKGWLLLSFKTCAIAVGMPHVTFLANDVNNLLANGISRPWGLRYIDED